MSSFLCEYVLNRNRFERNLEVEKRVQFPTYSFIVVTDGNTSS
nr:MAG TPA: hypothetical protein [Caudoviricetes sp.]DAW07436.1 MAG TPA: hypothetical protein [Caudoviricetes sp.]